MKQVCYRIKVESEEEEDLLIAGLSQFEPQGYESIDDLLIAYFDGSESDEITSWLKAEEKIFETNEVEDENWNRIWESSFEPVLVLDKVRIRAPFHDRDERFLDLIIEPRMAFGTGHHETTFLMMELMLGMQIEGKEILDLGTGTGILSILASKLNAAAITAVDVDLQAVQNTKDNLKVNKIEDVNIRQGDGNGHPASSFDIVLANINRNALLKLMESIVSYLRPGGIALLSGFLEEDKKIMVEKAELLFKTEPIVHKRGKWLAISVQKPK